MTSVIAINIHVLRLFFAESLSFMMDVVLFILVLHCLALQGAASQANPGSKVANCTKAYLVTVENKTDGINILIFSQNVIPGRATAQQPQNQKIETKTIYGHFLSQECGPDFFRCRKLLVVSSSLNQIATQHIVFVPLTNGILLLELGFNGTNLHFSRHFILAMEISCSPTTVVQILRGIYFVCINTRSGYLSAHEIYLNKTVIVNTYISPPLVHIDFSRLGIDLSTVTNFVHVNLDANTSSQFIYFAVAGSLYALVPPVYLARYVGNLAYCVDAEKLVYAGRKTLVAYCHNSSVVNFDIELEDWINQTSYDERGKPYVCPNQNVRLAVFSRASYIQYGLWSQNTLENINIPELEFDSGICFGTQEKTFFAYNSREGGVYVLELATASLRHITLSDDSAYEPVMVFRDHYLMIQERYLGDSSILVVDSQKNFSVLIEGQHAIADFLTIIEDIDLKCASETIPGIHVNNEISTDMPERPNTALIASTTTILSALIIIALLCAIFIYQYHRKSRNHRGPVQQATSDHDEAYHPLSANFRCQTPSMHSSHGPAYAVTLKPTHVYNEQQSKTASQGGNHVFEAKRIESPAQQKPTTENGLAASSVNFPIIATPGKHNHEVCPSVTSNADATATDTDGVVEESDTKPSEQGDQEIEMTTMSLSSSYEDSAIAMDESFNSDIPIQEAGVCDKGHSSLVEDLESVGGGDNSDDTDPLLPSTEN